MKKNDRSRLVKERGTPLIKVPVTAIDLPAQVWSEINREQQAFEKHGRFEVACDYFDPKLRTLTREQKLEIMRDGQLNAVAQAAREGWRGQPKMVERFRAVSIMVEWLKANGVPFGVCPNSRMNKVVRKLLNEQAARSTDTRKSRRKQITAGAVRALLKDIRGRRAINNHFLKIGMYD